MRKIFVMLAVVFSAAFGTVSIAADDIEPKYFNTAMEIAVKLKFCEMLNCVRKHATTNYCRYSNGDHATWMFLISETRSKLHDMYKEISGDWIGGQPSEIREAVKAFELDLKKAKILDGFVFTKTHANNCLADMEQLFLDNYTPTFNIELLK